MRLIVFCFMLVIATNCAVFAQPDSLHVTQKADSASISTPYIDSLFKESVKKEGREQFLADSFASVYLQIDSSGKRFYINQLLKNNLSYNDNLSSSLTVAKSVANAGRLRQVRNNWIIGAILGLLIFTAILNVFFGRDLKSVIQSFYSKQAFSQLDFEGGLINSWAFIGLFTLFSLTFGLVLYQVIQYRNVYYELTGAQLFFSLSLAIAALFVLKFLVLKLIGFVFDVNNLISQYITILNLTYFNVAFVMLGAGICFSLISVNYIPTLLFFTIGIIAVIFAWQYLRNSVNIVANFRFRKFYLFIYLCALEICPILILIKSLNI